jgi:hypothetical protein
MDVTKVMDIVFTFSPKDEAFATQLLSDLHAKLPEGAVMHPLSEGIEHAQDWNDAQLQIKTSNVFAIVLSPSALASPRINAEIDLAWRLRNEPGRYIVPIFYRECQIREDLETIQMTSFLPPKSYEDALLELTGRFDTIHQSLLHPLAEASTERPPATESVPSGATAPTRRGIRMPHPTSAQRRLLAVLGAAVILLLLSVPLVHQISYQVQLAGQHANATQTALANLHTTQTLTEAYRQGAILETQAAGTASVQAITATAQVYTPYMSKSPTCNDSYWIKSQFGSSQATLTCAPEGLTITGAQSVDLQFKGAHTLPFKYEMDVTITPLKGDVLLNIWNSYYGIKGNLQIGFFNMTSTATNDVPSSEKILFARSYLLKYRYDGRQLAVYINGTLLYSKSVVITYPSIGFIDFDFSSASSAQTISVKVSDFSYMPIH